MPRGNVLKFCTIPTMTEGWTDSILVAKGKRSSSLRTQGALFSWAGFLCNVLRELFKLVAIVHNNWTMHWLEFGGQRSRSTFFKCYPVMVGIENRFRLTNSIGIVCLRRYRFFITILSFPCLHKEILHRGTFASHCEDPQPRGSVIERRKQSNAWLHFVVPKLPVHNIH